MTGCGKSVGRRGFSAIVLVGLALSLSSCAYGLGGEFAKQAQSKPEDPALKEAALTEGGLPLKPAALVEVEPTNADKVAPAAAATASAVNPSGFPNLNEVPPPSKSKLLTDEEKAKVIADLEALAKKQGAALAKERAAAKAACDGLTAEELRKQMLQGAC
jgi:hypothetical protein